MQPAKTPQRRGQQTLRLDGTATAQLDDRRLLAGIVVTSQTGDHVVGMPAQDSVLGSCQVVLRKLADCLEKPRPLLIIEIGPGQAPRLTGQPRVNDPGKLGIPGLIPHATRSGSRSSVSELATRSGKRPGNGAWWTRSTSIGEWPGMHVNKGVTGRRSVPLDDCRQPGKRQ